MKKTLAIIIIVLATIITTVWVIFAILNDKVKSLDENVIIIREKYTELSNDSTNNILLRRELIEKLGNFNEVDYATAHEEYLTLLNNYNNNVAKIDSIVEILDSKCDIQYEVATINILCRGYADLYEEVINVYITSIKDYNNKIKGYNQRNKTEFASYNLLHTEYVDLNKDGTYQGL